MKRFIASALMLMVFGATLAKDPVVIHEGTQVIVLKSDKPTATELKDIPSTDLVKVLYHRAAEKVSLAVKGTLTAGALWSISRQYQLAHEHGFKALFTHKDSWPQWFIHEAPDKISAGSQWLWQHPKVLYTLAGLAGVYSGWTWLKNYYAQKQAKADLEVRITKDCA